VSDTWDEEDRAIARALDVSDDGGPVDERAIDEYREVLGHLPDERVAPPSDLEDRIVAAALAQRPATTSTLDRARAQRRSRLRAATLGAVAVAAAIIVAVLVMTHDSSSPLPKGRIASVAASRPDIDALLRQPGTRTGTFDHGRGKVVLGQTGKGTVYALGPSEVVSVWIESERGTAASLGSAVPIDGAIAFSVDHPNLVTAVRLTRRDGTLLARAVLSAG
jgi:hypothetical protein